jgi:TonB-linked SusC/RagA family outer membrane protein
MAPATAAVQLAESVTIRRQLQMQKRDTARISAALALALLSLLPVPAAARQMGALQGTVTEAGTQRPLVNVRVAVQGTQQSTMTNAQGRYLLPSVPAGERALTFELLGFAETAQTVMVRSGETHVVNVTLVQTAIALQEIVVTGVAGAMQRAKVPFDVAKLEMTDLPVPAVTAGTAIQGKIAGATVVSGTGRPGAAPSILLRGPTSLNATGRDQEPLYIVDGIILNQSMVDLDALDIANIEVVRGAAAASLYGSRAASGVIQITTRRGQATGMDGVRYTARTEFGSSTLPTTPATLLTQAHHYAMTDNGLFVDATGAPCQWLACGSLRLAGQRADGRPADAWNTFQTQNWPGATYDHVARLFQPGDFRQHYISAEGRSGATNFLVSFSNMEDAGVLRGVPGQHRNNFRLNADQAIRQNLAVSASAFYSRGSSGQFTEDSGNPLFNVTRMPAGVDLMACEADQAANCLNDPLNLILQPDPGNAESPNPLYMLLNRQFTIDRSRFMGAGSIRFAPVGWLNVDAAVSYDRLDLGQNDYWPKGYRTIDPSPVLNEGYLQRYAERNESLNGSLTGTIRWNLSERVSTRTQLRYLVEEQTLNWNDTYGWNFQVGGIPTFSNISPTNIRANSREELVRADGFFVITSFDIADRYIIDALVRNDGSSLFGPGQRRHGYYRIAAAWRMTEEPWFQLNGVDELKLRYSDGTAGGRPGYAAQYETFDVAGGTVTPVTLGNRNLAPEHSREQEIGVDAMLGGGRYNVVLTYANAVTTNQILPVPLPGLAGFQAQWRNAGTLASNSWEATFDTRLLERAGFSWSARLTLDRTVSTIRDLDVPPFTYGVPGQELGNVFYARPGERVGTFYGIRFATQCGDLPTGVDCSQFALNDDGLLVYVGAGGLSANAWGSDAPLEIQSSAPHMAAVRWGAPIAALCVDRSTNERRLFCELGNTMPDYSAGLGSTISFGGLSIYGLLNSVQGVDVYNQPLQWAVFRRTAGLYDQRDVPEAERKPLGYYDALYGVSGLRPSSHFVEDASYIKLRELSVGYRVPQARLARIPLVGGFSGAAVSATGRNLLTWTSYRGFDPEVGRAGGETGSAALGRVEGFQYPNFRTWTLVLELNF